MGKSILTSTPRTHKKEEELEARNCETLRMARNRPWRDPGGEKQSGLHSGREAEIQSRPATPNPSHHQPDLKRTIVFDKDDEIQRSLPTRHHDQLHRP